MTDFVPARSARFAHASDAIFLIEEYNCSRGCRWGAASRQEWEEIGPGGSCRILAQIAIGDGEPVPEIKDNGVTLLCTARQPAGQGEAR